MQQHTVVFLMIMIMKKIFMGLRKDLASLSLLLVLLLLLVIMVFETPYCSSSGDGFARFGSSKTGSASEFSPVESVNEGFVRRHKGGVGESGESSFVDEKRRIHTGPNPLHNR